MNTQFYDEENVGLLLDPNLLSTQIDSSNNNNSDLHLSITQPVYDTNDNDNNSDIDINSSNQHGKSDVVTTLNISMKNNDNTLHNSDNNNIDDDDEHKNVEINETSITEINLAVTQPPLFDEDDNDEDNKDEDENDNNADSFIDRSLSLSLSNELADPATNSSNQNYAKSDVVVTFEVSMKNNDNTLHNSDNNNIDDDDEHKNVEINETTVCDNEINLAVTQPPLLDEDDNDNKDEDENDNNADSFIDRSLSLSLSSKLADPTTNSTNQNYANQMPKFLDDNDNEDDDISAANDIHRTPLSLISNNEVNEDNDSLNLAVTQYDDAYEDVSDNDEDDNNKNKNNRDDDDDDEDKSKDSISNIKISQTIVEDENAQTTLGLTNNDEYNQFNDDSNATPIKANNTNNNRSDHNSNLIESSEALRYNLLLLIHNDIKLILILLVLLFNSLVQKRRLLQKLKRLLLMSTITMLKSLMTMILTTMLIGKIVRV